MTVLHYRDHQKAVDRWSNMERVKLVEKFMQSQEPLGADFAEPLRDPWDLYARDTSPCELSYAASDGDVA